MKNVSIDYRMLWVTSCLTKHQLLYKYYILLQITRRANFSGVFEVESLEIMTKLSFVLLLHQYFWVISSYIWNLWI